MPRIQRYDAREENGVRWWRLVFAPLDFLIDPGVWIRDTRIVAPSEHGDLDRGVRVGPFRVALCRPQFYFDHGKPVAPSIIRRFRRSA